MNKVSRNYGIDLFKILSMIAVVSLHVLSFGGILGSVQSFPDFSIAWFFEILAYPAVDCFVLVSGFVGYRETRTCPKLKNIISLYFSVSFYSFFISLLFKLFYPASFGLLDLVKSCLPLITNKYWFFSAYVGMFLLSPLLNVFVRSISKKQSFIFGIIFIFFVFVSITRSDIFGLASGYSTFWFVFMYIIGAIIKKYNIMNVFSKKIWFLFILISFLLTWVSKITLKFMDYSFLQKASNLLVLYISPTIILMAISGLCLFSKINVKSSLYKIIVFLSSSSLSVYLIHDNENVRAYLMRQISDLIRGYNFWTHPFFIIGAVVGIFIGCILIDKVRMLIFDLLKIDTLSEKIEKLIKKIINTTYNKIKF